MQYISGPRLNLYIEYFCLKDRAYMLESSIYMAFDIMPKLLNMTIPCTFHNTVPVKARFLNKHFPADAKETRQHAFPLYHFVEDTLLESRGRYNTQIAQCIMKNTS